MVSKLSGTISTTTNELGRSFGSFADLRNVHAIARFPGTNDAVNMYVSNSTHTQVCVLIKQVAHSLSDHKVLTLSPGSVGSRGCGTDQLNSTMSFPAENLAPDMTDFSRHMIDRQIN